LALSPRSGGFRRRPGRNPWLRLGLFAGAAALFVLGYYWGNQYKQPEQAEVESAVLLRPPLMLPEFQAEDADGGSFGRRELEGRWHLLLVAALDAPTTGDGLAQMNRIHNRLGEHPGLREAVRPLLISPDPERDSAERLQQTVGHYNPDLLTAAGTKTDLAELLAALGTDHGHARRQPATLYLLDPQVQVPALFTAEQEPAAVARDIREIIQATP